MSDDTPMTWHQAHEFCASVGAHMLTTATFEDASVPWLTDLGAGWLGATDETSPGTWTWNTGEAFAYTNWAAGEPANGHHYLALHESLDLTWVALDAAALRVPICEYPPAAAAVLRRNHITGIVGIGSTGVYGTNCRAKDNVYIAASADSCGDAGGNHWVP